MSGFEPFKLHPKINNRLEALGFSEPTKIQEKAIPLVQAGKDVSGLAQTGTGKTAAFLIPILQRLYVSTDVSKANDEGSESGNETAIKAFESWTPRSSILILVPTRELAEQVANNLKDLTTDDDVSYVTIYGGVPYEKQKKLLEKGATFVVATPGRLIDLYKDNFFDPTQVKCVVFDEADRMFDMGFKEDMKFLLDRIPKDRQFLVFSATLNFDVLTVAYEYGSDPVEIEIDRSLPKTDQVQDVIFHVGHNEKPKFLMSIAKNKDFEQAVIFTNFVRNVPKVEKFLEANGFKAKGISSALSQSQRNKVMESFRSGETNILVATDVAARGLDIENVDVVVNFELPDDSENYVHRIGRTGRAGRKGLAFSLVSEKDVEALKRLESFLKTKLEIGWLEDNELEDSFKPFPYTYDPHGKMKDLSGKRKDSRKEYGKKGSSGYQSDKPRRSDNNKSKKYESSDKSQRFDSKKSKSDANYASDSSNKNTYKKSKFNKNKSDFKSKSTESVSNTSRKSKASKRYKGFKTVSSNKKSSGSLISKIKSFFS